MLTRKTEYAIRAMWELSQVTDKITTATQIAQRQAIPPKYLPQIMSELGRAGLVNSSRGFGGGLRLAKPKNEIMLLEIIEAIQGKMTLFECQCGDINCGFYNNCNLRSVYHDAQQAMESVFTNTHLTDLSFG